MPTSISETLVLTGAVQAEAMNMAVAEFGDGPALHAHLLERHVITATQLAHAVAATHDLPYTDLTTRDLDPEVIAMVPSALCRRYKLIPLERRRRSIVIGMVEPTDIIAMDDIQRVIDFNVQAVVVSEEGLRQAFERYLRSDEELTDLSERIVDAAGPGTLAATETLADAR